MCLFGIVLVVFLMDYNLFALLFSLNNFCVQCQLQCSIDGLLDRTIKHMLFLRNTTDQAAKLKQRMCQEVHMCECQSGLPNLDS